MIVSFDIGGSAIKAAIASSDTDIRTIKRIATPVHDFEAFKAALHSVTKEAAQPPSCLALSLAGVVDPDNRKIICANIPCINGRDLVADLEQAFGIPVLVANDADCFAVAEAELGAGRGHRIVFGIILGTGVGGGLVSDGRLVNASGGFAGEWGHGPIAPLRAGSPPVEIPHFQCGCGQSGCIDTVGGARGLERLHETLHQLVLSSEDIIAQWQNGSARAARTADVYVDLVAAPLAMCVNLTGATIVPVGGGLSNAAPLIDALDLAVRSRILRRFARPLVVQSTCRIEPGLIGAALLGLQAEKKATAG